MELWIRSQDRCGLTKVNDLHLKRLTKEGFEIGELTSDWHVIANDSPSLGSYKTKERAIEVLNDIYNFIGININARNSNYQELDIFLKAKMLENSCKVFDMPEY